MSKDVTFDFTSYFESFVKDYQALINKVTNIHISNQPVYSGAWHVRWRGYNQVTNILDTLYDNADRYLKRKYDKYIALKNRNM